MQPPDDDVAGCRCGCWMSMKEQCNMYISLQHISILQCIYTFTQAPTQDGLFKQSPRKNLGFLHYHQASYLYALSPSQRLQTSRQSLTQYFIVMLHTVFHSHYPRRIFTQLQCSSLHTARSSTLQSSTHQFSVKL